jgi:hypothetical protein
MELLELYIKHFWFLAVIVSVINWYIKKRAAQKYIKENPQLKEGYAILLRGYLIWPTIPWIVMGIGCTVGGVPSMMYYFRPQDANPYVLAWYGSWFVLLVLFGYWLFFKNGVETLNKHPGFINFSYRAKGKDKAISPAMLKVLWLLIFVVWMLSIALFWFMDFPVRLFH